MQEHIGESCPKCRAYHEWPVRCDTDTFSEWKGPTLEPVALMGVLRIICGCGYSYYIKCKGGE